MSVVIRSLLLIISLLFGAAPVSAAQQAPCCGVPTPAGERLTRLLDGTGVDHLWQSGWHVNWRTGETDRPTPGGPEAKTHCSAFVAALAERLGVYVLRPPEHKQELLANAQMRWLRESGADFGWVEVAGPHQAQAFANEGQFVVAAWENPNPHRPGHIAILRPSTKSEAALAAEGPQETQSGTRNYLSTSVSVGFRRHKADSIRYFAHSVNWNDRN